MTNAWYFAHTDERLAYGDGREVAVGITHEIEGTPILCTRGLHGSIRVLDALLYASSHILYRVKISGNVIHGKDKLCGQRREYLARYDIEELLREFDRKQAQQTLEKVKSFYTKEEFDLLVKWLETGDQALKEPLTKVIDSILNPLNNAIWSAFNSSPYSAAVTSAYYAVRQTRNRTENWGKANQMLTKMTEDKYGEFQ